MFAVVLGRCQALTSLQWQWGVPGCDVTALSLRVGPPGRWGA